MIKKTTLLFVALTALFLTVPHSMAVSAHKLEMKSQKALDDLYHNNPKAREVGEKAVGILVFPDIIKAGFILGGQRGDGVLFKGGTVAGYYNTTSISYGLQAGVQKFGYVLFFMNEKALNYLNTSDGFELGGAPSLTVIDQGVASSLSTTTLQKDIYAMFFHQQGLMAALSLQGTKITEYIPSK